MKLAATRCILHFVHNSAPLCVVHKLVALMAYVRSTPDCPQAGSHVFVAMSSPMQVLVQLHSSSVNPVDTAARAGHIPDVPLPCIIGGDLAGVVVEADEGSRFKQGDHVAALTPGGGRLQLLWRCAWVASCVA